MERQPCVYILASGHHGTLYIGVTSDLMRRLHQHRSGDVPGFTRRYNVKRLVHFEMFEDMPTAIAREKQLKAWRRDWKAVLVEQHNPQWEDQAVELGFAPLPKHHADESQHSETPRLHLKRRGIWILTFVRMTDAGHSAASASSRSAACRFHISA